MIGKIKVTLLLVELFEARNTIVPSKVLKVCKVKPSIATKALPYVLCSFFINVNIVFMKF